MALVKKDTFAGLATNTAQVLPDFTEGWVKNDGAGDLTLTFANGEQLVLKAFEEQRWDFRANQIIKGFSMNGPATTFRWCYLI